MKRIFRNMFAVLCLAFLTAVDVVKAEESFAIQMQEPITCSYEFAAFPARLKAYEQYRWDLLKRRDFRTSYYKLLGSSRNERWLKLTGLSNMSKYVVINQLGLVMTDSCKMHECGTHNIVILYDPAHKNSYGMLREEENVSFLGNPSLCYQQALQNLELGNKAR